MRRTELARMAASAAAERAAVDGAVHNAVEMLPAEIRARRVELAVRRAGHRGDVRGKFVARLADAGRDGREKGNSPQRRRWRAPQPIASDQDGDESSAGTSATSATSASTCEQLQLVDVGSPESAAGGRFPQQLPQKHDAMKTEEVTLRQFCRRFQRRNGFYIADGSAAAKCGSFTLTNDELAKKALSKRDRDEIRRGGDARTTAVDLLYEKAFDVQDYFGDKLRSTGRKCNVFYFDGIVNVFLRCNCDSHIYFRRQRRSFSRARFRLD